jgi:hypothetical protein
MFVPDTESKSSPYFQLLHINLCYYYHWCFFEAESLLNSSLDYLMIQKLHSSSSGYFLTVFASDYTSSSDSNTPYSLIPIARDFMCFSAIKLVVTLMNIIAE